MKLWSAEIIELEKLLQLIKDQMPDLERELGRLTRADDENMVLLYSRRCLEVIITELCENELKRSRGTEPLKGVIDKLNREKKVPFNIIASMHSLNTLSTFGAHPKAFEIEQVKPVLNNLDTIIKWYLQYYALQNPDQLEEAVLADEPVRHQTLLQSRFAASPGDAGQRFESSIAVLPFKDISPQKDQEYFCDGITEEIINSLTQLEKVKVIARTSVFAFKDKYVDMREIGRLLDVENLLEGSIRKDGIRLRITIQLIRSMDGSHIWSERYDRDLIDVFAIQDEISMATVDALKLKLLGREKTGILRHHTKDPIAYNLYLKGNHYSQLLTSAGCERAIEYYEQALEKDPDYGLAYSGLAVTYMYSTIFGNQPPHSAYPKANEYAKRALELDNALAEAHSVTGLINTYYYWNWEKAEQSFKRALKLNPNSALIHIYYSYLLTCTERHQEAIAEARRAQELDPLSSYISTQLGQALYFNHQFDQAIEELRNVIAMHPEYSEAHLYLAVAYAKKIMFKKAVMEYERAFRYSGGVPMIVAGRAVVYNILGKSNEADRMLEMLMKRSETEYIPASSFYLIHKSRGDDDMAYRYLEKACEERDILLPWLRIHPDSGVRIPEDGRYRALLRKVGLEK